MSRSRGSILLARTGHTQDVIAARAGVSRVAVSKWINGGAKPGAKKRDVLLAEFGVPVAAWDEPPAAAGKVAAGETSKPIPPDAHAMNNELELMAHEFLTKMRTDTAMSPLERAKVMAALSTTLNHLEKRTGDIGAKLFDLPIWKRIVKAIDTALDGHPKAAEAVARELRKAELG